MCQNLKHLQRLVRATGTGRWGAHNDVMPGAWEGWRGVGQNRMVGAVTRLSAWPLSVLNGLADAEPGLVPQILQCTGYSSKNTCLLD